jgi:hypothetical protein
MIVLSDRFSAIAAASRTWVDKFMRGIVIVLCVVLAIFLGGQLIEASVFVLGQIPRFTEVKCDIVNGVLSSRYFPADLKARERGIRYKTGCAE